MIETSSLTKQYGSVTAVDALSFRVEPGEVLGFLGPNGAGKSTTMKMLAGFLAPTSGSATVAGFDVVSQGLEAKRRLGYLPEGAPSYPEMTPLSFLEFVADLRGLGGSNRRERIGTTVEQLRLEGVLNQPIETLSKGFKRRVGLAQALVHDPDVLILDEPTDGLDPNQKHQVRDLINNLAESKLVIISTHILEEVEAVCSRAVIIANGKLLADDTPEGLKRRSRFHNAVTLELAGDMEQALKNDLAALPNVGSVVEEDGKWIVFPADGTAPVTAVTDVLTRHGANVAAINVEGGRLDEVFRTITGGQAE